MLRTGQMDILPITEHDRTTYEGQAISVVNVYGDALGAVILLGQDEMSSMEATLVKTTANFLGSIMED
jgi:hypothetical protein